MPPTVLFDLDGTLVHSAPDLVGSLNSLLIEEGRDPIDADAGSRMIGRGGRILVVNGFAARGEDLTKVQPRLDLLTRRFLTIYESRIVAETRPYPGVEATLARFAEAGWRLGVCTNKSERLAKLLLDRLGMLSQFHVVTGADTFGIGKPDPRPVLESIEAAGGRRSSALMVGDSRADVEAARAAGIPVVGVTFGYTEVPVATFAPDRVVDDFAAVWPAAGELVRI